MLLNYTQAFFKTYFKRNSIFKKMLFKIVAAKVGAELGKVVPEPGKLVGEPERVTAEPPGKTALS